MNLCRSLTLNAVCSTLHFLNNAAFSRGAIVLPGIIASVIAFVFIYLLVSSDPASDYVFVVTLKSAGIRVLPKTFLSREALL